jgi:hypothetical protein
MQQQDLAWWRMHNLGLVGGSNESTMDTLRWLGAVQSQEYRPATWSLAQRSDGVYHAHIDQLFDDGHILRTHVLRATWHFVHLDDIRLLLQVTGPRVQISNRSRYKAHGIDQHLCDQCNQHMVDALSGQNDLTRPEIGELLREHGIDLNTPQLNCVMLNAELEAIVCSGRREGKDQTYALLDERAPNGAGQLDPDEALAAFTRRYFTSHGPATIQDFRAWGSLTVADIRRGINMLGSELESFEYDGLTYWYVHGPPVSQPNTPHVALLQRFDEYLSGYLQSRNVIDQAGRYADLNPDRMSGGPVIVDSQLLGHWHRAVSGSKIKLQIRHHDTLDTGTRSAIEAEADRYGAFLGMEATVEYKPD